MNAIGGYFGWELQNGIQPYHHSPAFKSGRSALHYILKTLRPKNVFIPFYCCNALLEPFDLTNTKYTYYSLDETLNPKSLPELHEGEYFLYVNYFDLKRKTLQLLANKYNDRLIVDNSQAFYLKAKGKFWQFNSCRKFFGVPDGGYAAAPDIHFIKEPENINEDFITEHLKQRALGNIEEGYKYYLQNEKLSGSEISQMSTVSRKVLSAIDYEFCSKRRMENFFTLHDIFQEYNKFVIETDEIVAPMAYPFLPKKKIAHDQLWKHKIYAPVLWKDVLNRNKARFRLEKNISESLLPLPIDHRYDNADMHKMAHIILNL